MPLRGERGFALPLGLFPWALLLAGRMTILHPADDSSILRKAEKQKCRSLGLPELNHHSGSYMTNRERNCSYLGQEGFFYNKQMYTLMNTGESFDCK